MNLLTANVAKLPLPSGKTEVIFFDDDLPGFGLRLRAGGKPTWVFQYRFGGLQRRENLGRAVGKAGIVTAKQAHKKASEMSRQVALKIDPRPKSVDPRQHVDMGFPKIVARYLDHKRAELKPRSFAEVERHLNDHWKGFNRRPITDIGRRDIALRLDELSAERGPFSAARARSSLSNLFTWALNRGLVDANPVIGTDRAAERSRDRVLTDAEIVEVWNACEDDDYGKIVQLLLLTGQRREEVGGMLRSELNYATREWTIGSDRTKNGRTHIVPLSDAAISIIGSKKPSDDRELIFGRGEGSFSGWSAAKKSLDERTVDARPRRGGKVPPLTPWRLHDLRRTAATGMVNLGVAPHVVEAVLNHISGHKAGVAGVYNHAAYAAEKRAALDLWAVYVQQLVGWRPAKIASAVRT